MPAIDPETLVAEHRLYDQYVDVVSAFEWLFTATASMPDTVEHFERFPAVEATDGYPATPDFTVLFKDRTGLAGELARIALHEESVEALCKQIARYDSLTQLPGKNGQPTAVSHVDVLLLVPLELGTDAVRRVISERLQNPDHDYKPSHAPCVVQYVAQPDKYVLQRRADDGNGQLRDLDRDPGLGDWLGKGDFKPPANGFAAIKAQRPFMNDSVAPLYLACQLWTKVFPTLTTDVPKIADYKPLITTADQLVAKLNEMYGRVSKNAVRRAMGILVDSRCAESLDEDHWRVAWGSLAHRGAEDVGEVLARRTEKPPAKGPIRRLLDAYADLGIPDPTKQAGPVPGKLF